MADIIQWVATGATILAALVTASNLGARITGYGFGIFLVGSLAWIAVAVATGQPALLWTNAVLTALNIFGMWRWLGRQAKVEKGAGSAADASHDTPGESLFPVSLLTRGEVSGERRRRPATASMRWPAFRAAGLPISCSPTAALPGWARRFAGSIGTKVCDRWTETLVIDGDVAELPKIERDQWPGR